MTSQLRARARNVAKRIVRINFARWLPPALLALLISRTRLFDQGWFASVTGMRVGRFTAAKAFVSDPKLALASSSIFDPQWYVSRYGISATPAQALLHYVALGDRIGLRPHPWFDPGFYRRHYRLGWVFRSALATFLGQWQKMPLGHPLFDPRWYAQAYPDVGSQVNPLRHFIEHGIAEGRNPNAYFDWKWYSRQNPDVAVSGVPAAIHYAANGALEWRSPGPNFDARRYEAQYMGGGSVPSQLDPLSHYLLIGRDKGVRLDWRGIDVALIIEPAEPRALPHSGLIDVVIPVYRGLGETQQCIESVLASSSRVRMRLRLHNDASPEPEVTRYLRSVARLNPDVHLVENPTNLGFVGTVNDAMRRAMEEPDFQAVVLLNSDTEVANDWLDRLLAHTAVREDLPQVATVTALSNNATICSYPKLGANPLPPECTTSDVDSVACAANAQMSVVVPTGVGFCMLITRGALSRLGYFDYEAFGKGYGEENDFCLRAANAGFLNLLALDVFVRHVGEVSFAEVSKPGKIKAEQIIRERYPDYGARVASFCAEDPGFPARLRLTFALWRHRCVKAQLLITHALGGGTERHVQEEVARLQSDGPVIVMRPVPGAARVQLQYVNDFDGFDIEIDGLDEGALAKLLLTMAVDQVHIHHTMGHAAYLRAALAIAGVPYRFIVHDYYSICPQVTLSNRAGQYCGEPGPQGCNDCIALRPTHGASDIQNWRHANEWLVEGAQDVVAPSRDCARRIQRYFDVVPSVIYHEPTVGYPAHTKQDAVARNGMRRVLILGSLAPHKGRGVVLAAVATALREQLPLEFHLVGDPQGDVPAHLHSRLTWTGHYEEKQLKALIEHASADAILFASPIPETYCYTLTAAMHSGLPIVATNIGALPERLERYPRAQMVPYDIDGETLARTLASYLEPLSETRERA